MDSGGEGRIGVDCLRVSYSLHPRSSPENLRGDGSCPGSHSNWRSWDVNPGLSDSKAASLAACRWRVPGSSVRGGGKMIRSEFQKFDIETSNPRLPLVF